MRIFLAMAFAASLAVAAGCSCATGECGAPVSDCSPCAAAPVVMAAPAPVVVEAPAPVYTEVVSAPVVVAAPAPVVVAAPAPAPAVCNPCAGL